jgi:hypothetical protein
MIIITFMFYFLSMIDKLFIGMKKSKSGRKSTKSKGVSLYFLVNFDDFSKI